MGAIMADGDHYMRKFLEIAVPYGQRDARYSLYRASSASVS